MADSDSHWRRWGETDAYFGVFADPGFRSDVIEQNRDAFFGSGRQHVEERLAAAERHFGPVARRRALEFGCGVGRLTLPLASAFGEIAALDIAPAMLAEAERNAQRSGFDNIRFALSDDRLSEAHGQFDLVMSCIVLQHIPVRRGLHILQELLGRVAPGGVAAIQLCIGRHDSLASRLRFWTQCNVPGVHELVNLKRGRPMREPFMQMNAYPLDRVIAMADAMNFGSCVISSFADARFRSAELLLRRH
ncbi:MAG: class I SAM-dependent methyltransferase [Sphingobium sp.]|nr:class I SAM-dependent methyltransferase [Sphingobium sp.]